METSIILVCGFFFKSVVIFHAEIHCTDAGRIDQETVWKKKIYKYIIMS